MEATKTRTEVLKKIALIKLTLMENIFTNLNSIQLKWNVRKQKWSLTSRFSRSEEM